MIDNPVTSPGDPPTEDAGPLVRLYAMTRGRARHARANFDLISIVVTARDARPLAGRVGLEHEAILDLCHRPMSVAEVSANLDLPLGVVRVLLGDLLDRELITVRSPAPVTTLPNESVLREVIDGIRAL